MTPDEIIDVVLGLDPLCDLPRTGWLLRGVPAPESVAAHSYAVAVTAMLLVDELRAAGQAVDGELVLRMALVHDTAEAATGDFPMPRKTPALAAALGALEAGIAAELLPAPLLPVWSEAAAKASLEARIVAAADKIQMMIKVLVYEERRSANLADFWAHEGNYRAMGLPLAEALFAAIRARRRT
ncbi:MAG TPA: HD family hydrolase [Polyangia bacterium]